MMKKVWVSLAWRALVNVEALNMTENVGNYLKHRRAPIAFYDESTKDFVIKYVPVVSGESLAHAYQVWLAEEAHNAELSVCTLCLKGELVKHGARVVLQDEKLPIPSRNDVAKAKELEKEIIKKCAVEDICGFLVPTDIPVKRTSLLYIGYMVPAYDSIKTAVMDPQFHVRHAPSLIGRGEEFPETGQALYYVEVASAIYTASAALDLTNIGRTSTFEVEDVIDANEKLKRAEVAVRSLYYLLSGIFGARRTRFLPNYRLLSVVAIVSKGAPFNVSPGHSKDYIRRTMERAQKFAELTNSSVSIFAYSTEPDVEIPKSIQVTNSLEELIKALIDSVKENLNDVWGRTGNESTTS
jgi:CRISPR-associated protein Csa2